MRAVGGRVFRLDRHLARLRRSAALIDLSLPQTAAQFATAITRTLDINGLREARLRLTITRGPGRPGDYVEAPGPVTTVITASPFQVLEATHYERGVGVVTSGRQAIPAASIDPAIKSTSRLAMVLARREASQRGGFESLLLNADGCLTEGTASNLFLLVQGELMTPAIEEGGLPGVTREAVIELARESGLRVSEGRVPAGRLAEAEEVFLTNTSWEVLPVTSIDERPVGDGSPGPICGMLLAAYRALLRRESGDA
jgi:branched-chain amino acid aminotransferase